MQVDAALAAVTSQGGTQNYKYPTVSFSYHEFPFFFFFSPFFCMIS